MAKSAVFPPSFSFLNLPLFLHLYLSLSLSLHPYFLFPPFLLLHAYRAADTMLNTRNKMLNNLEVDMTCISNQEPVKLALTSCAQGTCKIDQKGAVEVEVKVIFRKASMF